MKKEIIIGVIFSSVGFIMGYKLATTKCIKLLKSDELKEKISKEINKEIYKNRKETDNMNDVLSIEEIMFDKREQGEDIIDSMNETMNTYGSVSVSDLYDLIGMSGDYKYNKYGWTDISSAKIIGTKHNYKLSIDAPRKFK